MSDFTKEEIESRINRVSRESGQGDTSSTIFNTYYGINNRGTGAPVPINADQHGLTFFTRPDLNLSYDNIKGERIFLPLLTTKENSMFRAIRLLLDRRAFDGEFGNTIVSSLIDNSNPFICLLSNNLLSMSGWPDVVLDTYTSKEGRAREAWSMGDSKTRNFTVQSMSASFRNMVGDPITLLFFYWVNYISLVYEGRISPKPYMIVENEIDYMTRVYRLVLDPTRRYVRKISCCGAAFPTSVPIGASHNFSIDSPLNQENKDISINFQMMGFDYLDPIVISEFNTVVAMFTGTILSEESGKYVQLAKRDEKGNLIKEEDELSLLNHRALPYIDLVTYELKWFVEREVYERELEVGKKILIEPMAPASAAPVNTSIVQPTYPFDTSVGYNESMTDQPLNEVNGVVKNQPPPTTEIAGPPPPNGVGNP